MKNREEEIADLILVLDETERRLQELTGGQLDAISHRDGKAYLLREAQEQLRQSVNTQRELAETQSAILNALPANIALIDSEGVIISVNHAWRTYAAENAMGAEVDYGIGYNYLKLCEGTEGEEAETASVAAKGIGEVLKGARSVFSLEYPCHSPDEERWFRLLVTPLDERQPPGGAVVMHIDITEQKRVDNLLRLKGAALAATANGIMITNRNGIIEWVNDAFVSDSGYTAAEAVSRRPGDILHSGVQDREFYRNIWRTILSGQVWRGEIVNRRKDGARITADMTITPLRNDGGEITHFIAVQQDITERKKLEAQFLRAQRMESIGTLAGGIAHDLNNLLSPIMMGVGLLKQLDLGEESTSVLTTIEDSAQRGSDLVKQVLSFSRGVEGARVVIQLAHVVREVEAIVKNTFPKNIFFESKLEKDLWLVVGDPTQLNQVLLNLCVNARDAMGQGGRLTVSARNVEVDEQFAIISKGVAGGPYVILEVSDEGCGMPREVLDRVFEPFFTTKELGKGTGLGLSTLSGIVRSHGGFVNVYSEVGKGSVFRIYLPARNDARDLHPYETNERALPRGNGELILVVDDEASILTITKQTLEAFGYKILTAEDGAQAIGLYAKHQDDVALVLTDMMMPVMDGPTLITAMQRINPNVRVIAASGLNANGSVARAADSGVKHFLPKPYSAERMLALVKTVLTESPK